MYKRERKMKRMDNRNDRMAKEDTLADKETMLKKRVSLRCFIGTFDSTAVDNHHVVDLGFCLSPLQAFVRCDTAGAHVEVKEAHAPDVVVVATVATQATAAAIAHPKGGLFVCVLLEHAIVVDMVAV
jgi:hypothetical protein